MSEKRLSRRQALIVRELSRTPGAPVHWSLLADAIGVAERHEARQHVFNAVHGIRQKFGRHAVLGVHEGRERGYYLPADWERR